MFLGSNENKKIFFWNLLTFRLSTESPDYQLGWAVLAASRLLDTRPKTQLLFYCSRISYIINMQSNSPCFQTTQQQTNYSKYFEYWQERVKYIYSFYECKVKVSKFQKQIILFSFEPKHGRNYFLDSVCPLKWVK